MVIGKVFRNDSQTYINDLLHLYFTQDYPANKKKNAQNIATQ